MSTAAGASTAAAGNRPGAGWAVSAGEELIGDLLEEGGHARRSEPATRRVTASGISHEPLMPLWVRVPRDNARDNSLTPHDAP